jgi:serine/threonine-protein kinase
VLALHEASGLAVALRYHCAPADGEPGAERFDALRVDARALCGVTSPHVAALYEHIEVVLDGRFGAATVREYVEGASVRRLMHAARMGHEPALALLRAGLLALTATHAHGVTHRGYKPENLLVDAEGTPRLADFAVTTATDPDQSLATLCAQDVRAAYQVFVACVTGSRTAGSRTASARLPRRLRALAEPGTAGDGQALLDTVEAAGRASGGQEWRLRAQRELAGLVRRARPRRDR